jgi:hypothetical protein
LTGYVKSENHVVKLQFRPDPRPETEPGFVPRPAKPAVVTSRPISPTDAAPAQSPVRTNEKQRSTSREITPAKSVDLKIWE